MAAHAVYVVSGRRRVLCSSCARKLDARPCSTCGAAAGGSCFRCGQVVDLTRERVRIPHPAATGGVPDLASFE